MSYIAAALLFCFFNAFFMAYKAIFFPIASWASIIQLQTPAGCFAHQSI
jgi:hypothetical protein